jgi:hypothetical protein
VAPRSSLDELIVIGGSKKSCPLMSDSPEGCKILREMSEARQLSTPAWAQELRSPRQQLSQVKFLLSTQIQNSPPLVMYRMRRSSTFEKGARWVCALSLAGRAGCGAGSGIQICAHGGKIPKVDVLCRAEPS